MQGLCADLVSVETGEVETRLCADLVSVETRLRADLVSVETRLRADPISVCALTRFNYRTGRKRLRSFRTAIRLDLYNYIRPLVAVYGRIRPARTRPRLRLGLVLASRIHPYTAPRGLIYNTYDVEQGGRQGGRETRLRAPPELDFAAMPTEAENAEGVCFIFLMSLAGRLPWASRQK